MLITIENFGAIKHFTFDTEKDLYLIFGKNSMGKSYAISLVYLILKNILRSSKDIGRGNFKYFKYYRTQFFHKIDSDVKELAQMIEKNNDKEIDISHYIEKRFTTYLDFLFVNGLNESLINTFNDMNNLQNQKTQEKLKITIIWNQVTIILGLKENSKQNVQQMSILKSAFDSKVLLKKAKRRLEPKLDSQKIILYFLEGAEEHLGESYGMFIEKFVLGFFSTLQSIYDVYYLPASRSGLYQALSAFGQIVAELAKNRSFISKRIEIPAISEPVSDYFLHLSTIDLSRKPHHVFVDDVKEIENHILQGSVEFDSDTKRLFFTPSQTSLRIDSSAASSIDSSAASSMVSEISPIVAYLKYVLPSKAEKKPLVFIEEPEAHLHPETQVKLMAVFAKLVKDNKIKLVITSHSNYIFNKASNLVIEHKIDQKQCAALLFENTPEGSDARNLETDDYGIEDNNFVETAEALYEEKLELINKINDQ